MKLRKYLKVHVPQHRLQHRVVEPLEGLLVLGRRPAPLPGDRHVDLRSINSYLNYPPKKLKISADFCAHLTMVMQEVTRQTLARPSCMTTAARSACLYGSVASSIRSSETESHSA